MVDSVEKLERRRESMVANNDAWDWRELADAALFALKECESDKFAEVAYGFATIELLEKDNARLRKAIENAPHVRYCIAPVKLANGKYCDCTCWKRAALEKQGES